MSKRCCRSSPRCADCPVVAAAAARARRREEGVVAQLVGEILAGRPRRELPEPVRTTLTTLEQARRRTPIAA